MKYILMVLILILFVGVGAVNAGAADREEIKNAVNAYLERYYSTLLYKNNDRLLRWGEHITVRMIGLPEDLVSSYRKYIDYFNVKLKDNNVVIEDVTDKKNGLASITIILSDDLGKIALNPEIQKLLIKEGQSAEGYAKSVADWNKDGIIYNYRKLERMAYFVGLWNPNTYPEGSIADKNARFQMLKILYYALTFVPTTTKSNQLVLGDNIYPLNYLDMAYLVALYDPKNKPFAPLAKVKSNILNNVTNYLLSSAAAK